MVYPAEAFHSGCIPRRDSQPGVGAGSLLTRWSLELNAGREEKSRAHCPMDSALKVCNEESGLQARSPLCLRVP